MEKKKVAVSKVCHGHSRPVVDLFYSPVTPDGYFLISASKGKPSAPLAIALATSPHLTPRCFWGCASVAGIRSDPNPW